MNRSLIIAWLSLSIGCGGGRSQVSVPPPKADTATVAQRTDSSAHAPESVLPPAPTLDVARVVNDTALLRALSRDSLRDAEMLEKLHEVTAAGPSNGTEAEVDLAEMFDINVARYADHARVRFYLDFFQGPARERMGVWLERLPHYEPIIRSVFQARGLPSDLVYLALIESGYSNTAVSRSKAVGMWQFMRGTALGFGLTVDRWVDERRDFLKATTAAARYLAELTKRFNGSHYLAAAAYNSGAGTVSRGLRKLPVGVAAEEDEADPEVDPTEAVEDDRYFQLSDSRFLRKETKDYVPKLIAAAMIAKQPEKYGFPAIPKVEPYAVDSVPVMDAASLEVLARVSDTPMLELIALNPHLVRGITPPGRLTWVRVPNGKGVGATEALAAIPPAERVPALLHTVGRRETVGSIARRYKVSEREVRALNPGIGTATLAIGTTVRIPGTVRVQRLVTDDQKQPERRSAVHRVKRGETLASIAEQYRLTPSRLAAMNGLSKTAKLRAGQRLVVSRSGGARASSGKTAAPRRTAVAAAGTHVVRRGETLTALARRYGVTVGALMSANGLRSPGELKAGRRLTIPS